VSSPPTGTQVQVVSVLDVPAQEAARLGKMDALITYRLDALHTFTIRMPAEGLTPEKVDAAIRSDYNQRKTLINRTVSV
jgi:hypothetical protein